MAKHHEVVTGASNRAVSRRAALRTFVAGMVAAAGLALAGAGSAVAQPLPELADGAQMLVRIQETSTGRYLDMHETGDLDWAVVTRPFQDNNSQQWLITHDGGGEFMIQNRHTGLYVDAHEYDGMDWGLVGRPAQNNRTQLWVVTGRGGNDYLVQQVSNYRFMAAYNSGDYRVVTRPGLVNDTRTWRFTSVY